MCRCPAAGSLPGLLRAAVPRCLHGLRRAHAQQGQAVRDYLAHAFGKGQARGAQLRVIDDDFMGVVVGVKLSGQIAQIGGNLLRFGAVGSPCYDLREARELFENLVASDELEEFLTLKAYETYA